MPIRHRSAYYDTRSSTEALLSFVETCLASQDQNHGRRAAPSPRWSIFLPHPPAARTVLAQDGQAVSVVTRAGAAAAPALFAGSRAQISRTSASGFYVRIATTPLSFSAATQAGSDNPILTQPLLDFYAGLQGRPRRQRAAGDGAAQRKHRLRRRRRHLDRQPRRRTSVRQ